MGVAGFGEDVCPVGGGGGGGGGGGEGVVEGGFGSRCCGGWC